MEDNKEPQVQQPNPVPVMDIQPPRTAPPEQPVSNSQALVGPSVPTAPANEAVPPTGTNTPVTEGPNETAPVLAAVAPQHKSHHAPILAIVCAIIVAGVLATVAVMVYLSNSDSQNATDSNQPATTNTVQEVPATTGDVSETEKAIDDNLSGMNDATDYNDADVSDTSLGL